MAKARAYTGIGYNWDLEEEERNNDDKEDTSLVLKCNMRNMDFIWRSWQCYWMDGGSENSKH